jgi:SAM-dependent methyltransferase
MLLDPKPLRSTLAFGEVSVFSAFRGYLDLRGKEVLEVGGQIPTELAKKAEVKVWCAVDPRNPDFFEDGPIRTIRAPVMDAMLEQASFDLVFSCNAFQHISGLQQTLDRLFAVTRPGGFLYSHFGPIWSAPDGSHIENLAVNGRVYNFWTDSILPSWSHLVFSENELYQILLTAHSPVVSKAIAHYVYHSNWLNRTTYHELMRIVRLSGWEVLFAVGCKEFGYDFVPPRLEHVLCRRLESTVLFPILRESTGMNFDELNYRDIEILLRRPVLNNETSCRF